MKTWSYELDGHHLEVTNYYSFLKFKAWESLKLDEKELQKVEGSILRPSSYLCGQLESADGLKEIEAVIGPVGFGIGCHILVNGELVAGDVDKELNTPQAAEWKRLHNKGFAKYLFIRGVCRMGIPLGIVMTLINAGNALSHERLMLGFVTSSILFGCIMGTYGWWALKKQYASYGIKKK